MPVIRIMRVYDEVCWDSSVLEEEGEEEEEGEGERERA